MEDKENLSETCFWCMGSGVDSEMRDIGAFMKCYECEGTGLEGGIKAREKLNSILNIELNKYDSLAVRDNLEIFAISKKI